MALIALRDIRCIDYLAYGTIFTRAMFLPKKKGDVFFPARKAADERWGVVLPSPKIIPWSKIHVIWIPTSPDSLTGPENYLIDNTSGQHTII
jgi:hypothetical protein